MIKEKYQRCNPCSKKVCVASLYPLFIPFPRNLLSPCTFYLHFPPSPFLRPFSLFFITVFMFSHTVPLLSSLKAPSQSSSLSPSSSFLSALPHLPPLFSFFHHLIVTSFPLSPLFSFFVLRLSILFPFSLNSVS